MKVNRQIDAIVEAMRQVFEIIENEEVKKINIGLMGGYVQFGVDDEVLDNMTKKVTEIVNVDTTRLREKIKKGSDMLVEKALITYNHQKAKLNRLVNTQELYKSIYRNTQNNIQRGLPVTYKNGRVIGYKEYMEMNVRTTLQNEIVDYGLKSGEMNKTVFYICNYFNDCADDHAHFQGKVYYDERYKEWGFDDETLKSIESKIRNERLLGLQEVVDDKPFLTRRPNCRHKLYPISLVQALNLSPNQLLSEFNIKRGSYKEKDYKLTQEQRYNERQIRYYKNKANQNKELYELNPNNEQFLIQSQKDRVILNKWYKKQRKLIAENPQLERDYRRETKEKILQDLGAKYNKW